MFSPHSLERQSLRSCLAFPRFIAAPEVNHHIFPWKMRFFFSTNGLVFMEHLTRKPSIFPWNLAILRFFVRSIRWFNQISGQKYGNVGKPHAEWPTTWGCRTGGWKTSRSLVEKSLELWWNLIHKNYPMRRWGSQRLTENKLFLQPQNHGSFPRFADGFSKQKETKSRTKSPFFKPSLSIKRPRHCRKLLRPGGFPASMCFW